MNHGKAYALVLFIAACGSGSKTPPPELSAIGVKPAGEGRPKLWLTAQETPSSVTLTVRYEKGETAAPRVADIRIAHSESLVLADSAAGAGALAAGKELTTQEPQPGVVRLVLLSRDAHELGTGELAQLNFKKNAPGPAKVDILMDRPVFAPAESMQGLAIGDPLDL